jgi:hypothetical protein
MPLGNETIERKTQLQERLERNERIDRKTQLLERLDPEREVELERTFTNHVADAIGASSPRGELQQEIDNATEAYEDALDGVLNEILDEHLVVALRQPWVGPITKPQSTTPPDRTGALDYSSNCVELSFYLLSCNTRCERPHKYPLCVHKKATGRPFP